ncbi:metalloendopeptidase [Coemansia sp. Cherry 401B]|nr:metalloendopeptidase [Coemansia sp. Cherry 401B]
MDDEHESEYLTSYLLAELSPDASIRSAAAQATKLVEEFSIECSLRADIYKQVLAVYNNPEEMHNLCAEDKLVVERMMRGYHSSGISLPKTKQEQLSSIDKRLTELIAAFSNNVNSDHTTLFLTKTELAGVPSDFFDGKHVVKTSGSTKYVVPITRHQTAIVLRFATLESTRRAVHIASSTRCPKNIPLLQEAVKLRLQRANLLGFSSHAHFTLEDLMAKRPETVQNMLEDLQEQLTPQAKRELAQLRYLKHADAEAAGVPFTGLYDWDLDFYMRVAVEHKHRVKSTEVKQYFAYPHVIGRIFTAFEDLLGLRIAKVDRPSVWHPSVDLYEIWDAKSAEFLGHCYVDLFQRAGKFTGAATFQLRSGFDRADGTREYPAVALVTNFALLPPLPNKPVLLGHASVKTLLHELGHVFHNILSQCKWTMFHGTRVPRDAVELPSQTLESLAWNPNFLRRIAMHYQTGEPIPDELVMGLGAARDEFAGVSLLHKVFRAAYDIAIYSSSDGNLDVGKLYTEMERSIELANTDNVNTHGLSTVRHFMRGYDSRYYAYLWGQALTADMLATRFAGTNIDSPQVWAEYRNIILKPGGSRDIMAQLVEFLGRKPNSKALLKSVGLELQGPRARLVLRELVLLGAAWAVLVVVVVWMALCQEWSDMRWLRNSEHKHRGGHWRLKPATYTILDDVMLEQLPFISQRWVSDVLVNSAAIIAVTGSVFLAPGWQARMVLLRRIGWIMGILYFLRSITISVTTMPPSIDNCRPQEAHSASEWARIVPMMISGQLSGCTDKLFSGHTSILVISFLVWTRYARHWAFIAYSAVHTVLGIGSVLAVRLHYTVDVVLAVVLTWLVHCVYYMLLESAVCRRCAMPACRLESPEYSPVPQPGASSSRAVEMADIAGESALAGIWQMPKQARSEHSEHVLDFTADPLDFGRGSDHVEASLLLTNRPPSAVLLSAVAWMDGLHLR